MTEIMVKIKKNRPNLSDNSLVLYESHLKRLSRYLTKKEPTNNLKFLNNKNKIETFLTDKKPNTKKSYYNSIVVILGTEPEKYSKLIGHYEKLRNGLQDDYLRTEKTRKPSEKQQSQYVPFERLVELWAELKILAKFPNKKNYSMSQIQTYQNFLIISLYTLLDPERNDYIMKVVTDKQFKMLDKDDIKKQNFLVKSTKGGLKFVINEYKTSRFYDEKVIVIEGRLKTIINKWLKMNKSKNFLINRSGNPLTANNLTKRIKYITGKYLGEGKSFGTNMIRHIYTSDKFNKVLKEMEQTSKNMSHSMGVQQAIYIKDFETKSDEED